MIFLLWRNSQLWNLFKIHPRHLESFDLWLWDLTSWVAVPDSSKKLTEGIFLVWRKSVSQELQHMKREIKMQTGFFTCWFFTGFLAMTMGILSTVS